MGMVTFEKLKPENNQSLCMKKRVIMKITADLLSSDSNNDLMFTKLIFSFHHSLL